MTRQRRVILKILQDGGTHMTAKDIHTKARQHDQRITLTTVYRTLDLCKSLGVVNARQLSREHGPEWYEPATGGEHHHFTCVRCHRVIEFDAPEVDQIVQRLTREEGVTVTHIDLTIHGLCATCAAEAYDLSPLTEARAPQTLMEAS